FFTAGYPKSLVWIDFDTSTSGVFSWFYPSYFTLGYDKLLADYFFFVPLWIAEIMDYTAVLFELSGILFLIYSRKSWRFYLILATIFHLVNTLFLNIPFTLHVVVYGIWLLSPQFLKHKWLPFIFALPFLLE